MKTDLCNVVLLAISTAVLLTTALGDNERAVVADCRGGRFVVRLVTMEEGEKLAREEGGLPV